MTITRRNTRRNLEKKLASFRKNSDFSIYIVSLTFFNRSTTILRSRRCSSNAPVAITMSRRPVEGWRSKPMTLFISRRIVNVVRPVRTDLDWDGINLWTSGRHYNSCQKFLNSRVLVYGRCSALDTRIWRYHGDTERIGADSQLNFSSEQRIGLLTAFDLRVYFLLGKRRIIYRAIY